MLYTKIKYLKWYVPTELNNTSYIYTSIIEFCEKTKVKLIISYKNINHKGKIIINENEILITNNLYNKITYIEIGIKNEKKLIAFDLNDSPYCFSNFALNNADIVFKRSFIEKQIKKLPTEFQKKIKPMGLPFMVRPNKMKYKHKFFALFYLFKAKEILKFDRIILKRINRIIFDLPKEWNVFINTRKLNDFNSFKTEYLSNIIFYQKRLFIDDHDDDTKEIHKQRVDIIKTLKNNFPNNFKGGLQDNLMAKTYYPNLISNIDGNENSFLNALKESGICIYTRGLVLSNGWTLSEFLSQGKCIIAEKSQIEIPIQIKNNEQLLFYEDEDNLIDLCKQLIQDEHKRTQLGKEARDYYDKYVNPSVFIFNILQQVRWKK